jgi:hypothetical protein
LVKEAFRFFDLKLQNKLSKIDLNQGLITLKILLESDQLAKVFNFLDKDCDGYISFQEFGVLYSEGSNRPSATQSSSRYSHAGHMTQKSDRYKQPHLRYSSNVPVSERGFGALTLPSDNI